ncbi:MAG: 4Fe-4S dicluster domain-containing protein [Syntrophothermus sp.]
MAGAPPNPSLGAGKRYLLGPCAIVFNSDATGTWRIVRPRVDDGRCTHCGICARHCPADVMEVDVKDKSRPVVIDFHYCKGCGICANVCPRTCIEMVPERGEA